MDALLKEFVENCSRIADARNLGQWNPVSIKIQKPTVAGEIIVVCSTEEPSAAYFPLGTVWIPLDGSKQNFKQALKLDSANSRSPYNYSWSLLNRYLDLDLITHVMDFRGPQGPTGPAGIQGPQGPQGEQGQAGPAGVGNSLETNSLTLTDTELISRVNDLSSTISLVALFKKLNVLGQLSCTPPDVVILEEPGPVIYLGSTITLRFSVDKALWPQSTRIGDLENAYPNDIPITGDYTYSVETVGTIEYTTITRDIPAAHNYNINDYYGFQLYCHNLCSNAVNRGIWTYQKWWQAVEAPLPAIEPFDYTEENTSAAPYIAGSTYTNTIVVNTATTAELVPTTLGGDYTYTIDTSTAGKYKVHITGTVGTTNSHMAQGENFSDILDFTFVQPSRSDIKNFIRRYIDPVAPGSTAFCTLPSQSINETSSGPYPVNSVFSFTQSGVNATGGLGLGYNEGNFAFSLLNYPWGGNADPSVLSGRVNDIPGFLEISVTNQCDPQSNNYGAAPTQSVSKSTFRIPIQAGMQSLVASQVYQLP